MPGNEVPARVLGSVLRSGRIANAYLFRGPKGSPKDEFALDFGAGLLCDSATPAERGEACGRCWSCRAVSNHAHPDLFEVEKDGNTIKIKKSHEILREAMSSPYHSTRKVFIIKDAEDLTAEASNALLKILEEPPAHVTFILTAANTAALPETIVSRCQVVPFRKTPASFLAKVLTDSHGVDLAAAREVASYAEGDLERALRILKRHRGGSQEGKETLRRILSGSTVDSALEYSKLDHQGRVDVLSDLEIELVRELRERVSLLDSQGALSRQAEREVGRIYVALKSLLKAKERLEANTNAFLTLSVLFMDLVHALGGGTAEKG